jgi:hypothetical protein
MTIRELLGQIVAAALGTVTVAALLTLLPAFDAGHSSNQPDRTQ